jgi:hypothetical protein
LAGLLQCKVESNLSQKATMPARDKHLIGEAAAQALNVQKREGVGWATDLKVAVRR